MKIIKQVVGIDISKDTFTVRYGTVDEKQNYQISEAKVFLNGKKGFKQLIEWTGRKRHEEGILWYVMEATGVYYENLAYFLTEREEKIAVLLPNKAKSFARTLENKSKTDAIDAGVLVRFGLEKQLHKWAVPGEIMRQLKSLTREYQSLKELGIVVKNQLHAKESSYKPDRNIIKRLKGHINFLKKQQEAITKEIHELLSKSHDLKSRVDKISGIKGVGFITIVTVIAETNGFALINNQKQLASYAGLDIVQNESGLIRHATTISKRGNKHIRRAVYMPAVVACRFNKRLKDFYLNLLDRKKCKMIALIAVARKLLLLIYTIWKNNTEYDPNYVSL